MNIVHCLCVTSGFEPFNKLMAVFELEFQAERRWTGMVALHSSERGSWVVKGTELCDLKESTGEAIRIFAAGLSNPSSFYLTYSIYGNHISSCATFYRTCVTAY
jgi:hypothetical protein